MLDLTGLEVHQWLGVSAGALAAYHLATHWTWVTAVTQRFFAGTPGRSRLYYVLDALIMGGFVTIAVTGLVISSWLNLKLGSYDGWLTVHIWASVAALAALVAKIGLHWRWVVSVGSAAAAELTAALVSPAPAMRPLPVTAAVAPAPGSRAAGKPVGRREFFRMMAVVGATSLLAMSRAADNLLLPASAEASAATTGTVAAARSSTTTSGRSTTGATTSTSQCTVRCSKRCSYPGRCRKYVDSNGNGRCDLGECL